MSWILQTNSFVWGWALGSASLEAVDFRCVGRHLGGMEHRALAECRMRHGMGIYHLVMIHIAMENPPSMEVDSWESHLRAFLDCHVVVDHG